MAVVTPEGVVTIFSMGTLTLACHLHFEASVLLIVQLLLIFYQALASSQARRAWECECTLVVRLDATLTSQSNLLGAKLYYCDKDLYSDVVSGVPLTLASLGHWVCSQRD